MLLKIEKRLKWIFGGLKISIKTARAKIVAKMQSLDIFYIRRRGRIKKYPKPNETSHFEFF